MKKFISAAFVVAMAAASCTNLVDINDVPQSVGDVTFSAEFKEPASKATPDYNEQNRTVNILWEQGDKVGVYDKDGAPVEYSAVSAGATTTLTGSAAAGAATYYAMFPYDANASIASGVIATALPAEQIASKDRFTAHLAVASTTGTTFNFMNVCGLVRVYVGCAHVTKIEFKGNNDEVVAGQVSVTAATAAYAAGAETSKVVTVSPAEGLEAFEAGAYYFSVLPQTFANGFTVTAYLADGSKDVRTVNGSVTIPRSSLVVGKPFADITGTGTEADPFIIKTVHDLCNLSGVLSLENPNYVELAADIDMAGVTTWAPICNTRTADNIPELHFDGKNHTISNFAPTSLTAGEGGNQLSLFGSLYGSCKNLNVTNVSLQLTGESTVAPIAGFAGKIGGSITLFENVHVSGAVSAKKVVAGFVASLYNAKFVNCSAGVDIQTTDNHNGGFVARVGADNAVGVFENCYATGNINCATKKKGRFMGGFYGGDEFSSNLTFTRCWASGNIVGEYQDGSFAGYFDSGTANITDCYATGNITNIASPNYGKQLGGIVGVNKGNLTITRCYCTGNLTCAKAESVGGILGLGAAESVTISDCFYTGNLTAPTHGVGGIVGYTKGASLLVENCYAAGELSAAEKIGGIIGLAETATTVKNCKHNTNQDAIIGFETVAATQENNAKLSEAEVAEYATASKIATKLGWSTDVWNLTGDAPTLKCFDK